MTARALLASAQTFVEPRDAGSLPCSTSGGCLTGGGRGREGDGRKTTAAVCPPTGLFVARLGARAKNPAKNCARWGRCGCRCAKSYRLQRPLYPFFARLFPIQLPASTTEMHGNFNVNRRQSFAAAPIAGRYVTSPSRHRRNPVPFYARISGSLMSPLCCTQR